MGTRSWSSFQKYDLEESIYVKARYFDNDSDNVNYSDYFKFKGETLLEATILSIHKKSENKIQN